MAEQLIYNYIENFMPYGVFAPMLIDFNRHIFIANLQGTGQNLKVRLAVAKPTHHENIPI